MQIRKVQSKLEKWEHSKEKKREELGKQNERLIQFEVRERIRMDKVTKFRKEIELERKDHRTKNSEKRKQAEEKWKKEQKDRRKFKDSNEDYKKTQFN